MADPYKKACESIGKALSEQSKMILWIAERTLSAKEFKEFVDEFAKKPEDNHDELLDFLLKEGRRNRMSDREKLIKAWETFRDSNPYQICEGKEFRAIKEPEYCMGQMIADTIDLLKEQEPVEAVVGDTLLRQCGKCGFSLASSDNFCSHCGRAVKRNA